MCYISTLFVFFFCWLGLWLFRDGVVGNWHNFHSRFLRSSRAFFALSPPRGAPPPRRKRPASIDLVSVGKNKSMRHKASTTLPHSDVNSRRTCTHRTQAVHAPCPTSSICPSWPSYLLSSPLAAARFLYSQFENIHLINVSVRLVLTACCCCCLLLTDEKRRFSLFSCFGSSRKSIFSSILCKFTKSNHQNYTVMA